MPMVSTTDYIRRANREVRKYFISPTSAPNTAASFKCLSAESISVLQAGNTINLRSVNNRYDGADRSEMAATFKKVIQYMGSRRKAEQTRILTIDSQQRVGQAIAPELMRRANKIIKSEVFELNDDHKIYWMNNPILQVY